MMPTGGEGERKGVLVKGMDRRDGGGERGRKLPSPLPKQTYISMLSFLFPKNPHPNMISSPKPKTTILTNVPEPPPPPSYDCRKGGGDVWIVRGELNPHPLVF